MQDQLKHIKEMINSSSKSQAKTIAVTSGKGGVGKSNVSVNLAIALARLGKNVLVIDADTNLANIDILLGMNPKFNFLNYILDDIDVEKIIIKHSSGISILPNSSGNRNWLDLDKSLNSRIFELFFKLRHKYDYIIIDTAGGLSPISLEISIKADKVILITTSEPTAINDTYAMIKILNSMKKNISIDLLLNMVTSPSEVTDVYQRLSLVLEHFLDTSVGIAGYLLFDQAVRQAVIKQEPFLFLNKNSVASQNMINVAKILIGNTVENNQTV